LKKKSKQRKWLRNSIESNPPQNNSRTQSVPPFPEILRRFKQMLDLLQIIPRLQRVNIQVLANILGIDEKVVRILLPPLAQEFSIQIDGDYIRLNTSMNDLILALQQVYTKWIEEGRKQRESEDTSNRRIKAWLSILGEILVGSLEIKVQWVEDIFDITAAELYDLLAENGAVYGLSLVNDLIFIEPFSESSWEDVVKCEDDFTQMDNDQLNFISWVDENLNHIGRGKKKTIGNDSEYQNQRQDS
jgi:hypothetical protein